MDKEKLLDDINSGLRALVRDDIAFPVAEELPLIAPPFPVPFARENIQPPEGLYLPPGAHYRLYLQSTIADTEVQVNFSVLHASGHISNSSYRLNAPTAGTAANLMIAAPEGFLLSVFATGVGAALVHGQAWLIVQLFQNNLISGYISRLLVRGSFTNIIQLAWPGDRLYSVGDVPFPLQQVDVGDPAPGVEWVVDVPAGSTWKVQAIRTSFQTDANVANRRVYFYLSLGAVGPIILGISTTNHAANLTRNYTVGPGLAHATGIADYIIMPLLQGLWLPSLSTVRGAAENIQIGDQFFDTTLFVEERLVL